MLVFVNRDSANGNIIWVKTFDNKNNITLHVENGYKAFLFKNGLYEDNYSAGKWEINVRRNAEKNDKYKFVFVDAAQTILIKLGVGEIKYTDEHTKLTGEFGACGECFILVDDAKTIQKSIGKDEINVQDIEDIVKESLINEMRIVLAKAINEIGYDSINENLGNIVDKLKQAFSNKIKNLGYYVKDFNLKGYGFNDKFLSEYEEEIKKEKERMDRIKEENRKRAIDQQNKDNDVDRFNKVNNGTNGVFDFSSNKNGTSIKIDNRTSVTNENTNKQPKKDKKNNEKKCPKCNSPVSKNDNYCSKCGTKIS